MSAPIVAAFDLSLRATGWARITGDSSVHNAVIERGVIQPAIRLPAEDRLCRLAREVAERADQADMVLIEDYVQRSYTASVSAMVHGVARMSIYEEWGGYATLVSPATLKVYATGGGRATKPDMRVNLGKYLGIDERDDNVVDAIWLALLGRDLVGAPLVDLPKTHRRALEVITKREPVT